MSKANFVLLWIGKPRDFGEIARVPDIAAENILCPLTRCPACPCLSGPLPVPPAKLNDIALWAVLFPTLAHAGFVRKP